MKQLILNLINFILFILGIIYVVVFVAPIYIAIELTKLLIQVIEHTVKDTSTKVDVLLNVVDSIE